MTIKTHTGSCHCGQVRFSAELDLSAATGRCNCSFCAKTRAWGVTLKPEAFKLLAGEDALSEYQFNTKSGHHRFCKHCGVRTHGHGYVEEMGGAFCTISVAALDDVSDEELAAAPVHYSDGRANNWWNEPAIKSYL